MKKITLVLLCLCMALSAFTAAASEWAYIYVDINDVNITVDGANVYARNFVHEGTTYLSLRDIGTVLGYTVEWNGETSTASLTTGTVSEYEFSQGEKSSQTISVLVNDVNVIVDGVKIDARNFVYKDTTYLSLRDIGNATGFDVYWDEPSYTAVLTSPGKDRVLPTQPGLIAPEELYAKVNSIEIPEIYVKAVYDQAVANLSGGQIREFLELNVINYAYYVDMAKKLGLELTQEETAAIDAQYQQYVTAYGGEETFDALIQAAGYVPEDYKKQLKDYVATTQIFTVKVQNWLYEKEEGFVKLRNIAKPKYEQAAEQLKTPVVVVKHILIPFEENSDKSKEKAKAKEILSSLKKGEDFDKLLKQNNNDPGQSESGYQVYAGSGFVTEFETAALKLKKGEISDIVETGYGYHIIKAIDDYIYEMTFEEYFQTEFEKEIDQVFEQLYNTWAEKAVLDAGWNK